MVKIPATAEGVPAIRQMISEGRSINVTLIFSLDRYDEVMEAYLAGPRGATTATCRTVAQRGVASSSAGSTPRSTAASTTIGTTEALALKGKAAVAQGKLAYQQFRERSRARAGTRWRPRRARVQRPLWASTSTKNPAYPDTLYVDSLIGPDTVNTLPDATIAAFDDHGTLARTVDADVDEAEAAWHGLGRRRRRHGRRRPRARGRGRGVVRRRASTS